MYAAPVQLRGTEGFCAQHLRRAQQRRQRVAQCMRQDGQKAVFLPVAGQQRFFKLLQVADVGGQAVAQLGLPLIVSLQPATPGQPTHMAVDADNAVFAHVRVPGDQGGVDGLHMAARSSG